MIDKLNSANPGLTIRKMAPGTVERPNPHWVQTPSSLIGCPIHPKDRRNEDLPTIPVVNNPS